MRDCESTLQQLQDYAEDDEGIKWLDNIKALEGPNTPLTRLAVALDLVKTKLEPKDRRLKKTAVALMWPFAEKEVEHVISTIQREKMLLQLALTQNTR